MNYCPHCGKPLPGEGTGFKFCPECGKELPPPADVGNRCPVCGRPVPDYAIQCPNCDTFLTPSTTRISSTAEPDWQPASNFPASHSYTQSTAVKLKTPLLSVLGCTFLIPLFVSLPFLILGIWNLIDTNQSIQGFVTTTGEVVRNTTSLFSDGDTLYVPVIEFYPKNGDKVTFTDTSVGSIPPAYQPGDKVEVLYNPTDLRDARIKSFVNLYLFPVIFIAAGILPILVSLIIYLVGRRAIRKVNESGGWRISNQP